LVIRRRGSKSGAGWYQAIERKSMEMDKEVNKSIAKLAQRSVKDQAREK